MEKNPRRKHSRDVFYKYMSADTAKAVLRGRSFRWSSPLLFNDPFDVPRELAFGVSPDAILDAVARRWVELLRNPPKDCTHLNATVQMVLQSAHAVDRTALVDGIAAKVAVGLKTSNQEKQSASLEAVRQMWRDTLPGLRILCLSGSPGKTSMWYHYAEKYTGAVIEVACSDELDSPWIAAEAVQYPKEPPEIFTPVGWGHLLTLKLELAVEEMLRGYIFHKTPDWSYEEEWRVFAFKSRPEDTGQYFDYPVHEGNFLRVFLGPRMADADRAELLSIVGEEMPHMKAYRAQFEL